MTIYSSVINKPHLEYQGMLRLFTFACFANLGFETPQVKAAISFKDACTSNPFVHVFFT
jgi:hypothetical protein